MAMTSDAAEPELYEEPALRINIVKDVPCICEVRRSSAKGRGLYMTQSAHPGDVIYSEKPAVVIPKAGDNESGCDRAKQPKDSWRSAAALATGPQPQLEAVMAFLEPLDTEHPAYEVFRDSLNEGVIWLQEAGVRLDPASLKKLMLSTLLNGWGGDQGKLLFIWLSMTNHSCDPSAVMVTEGQSDPALLKVEVRALVDLKEGDEVTLCYIHDVMLPPKERAAHLMKGWFFSNVTPLASDEFINAYVKEGPDTDAAVANIIEANGFAMKAWDLGHSSQDPVAASRHLKNALGAYQLVLKSASGVLHSEHGWVLNAQRRMASILLREQEQFPGTAGVALKLCSAVAAGEEKIYRLGRVRLTETHSMAVEAAELSGDRLAADMWKAKVAQGRAIRGMRYGQ